MERVEKPPDGGGGGEEDLVRKKDINALIQAMTHCIEATQAKEQPMVRYPENPAMMEAMASQALRITNMERQISTMEGTINSMAVDLKWLREKMTLLLPQAPPTATTSTASTPNTVQQKNVQSVQQVQHVQQVQQNEVPSFSQLASRPRSDSLVRSSYY